MPKWNHQDWFRLWINLHAVSNLLSLVRDFSGAALTGQARPQLEKAQDRTIRLVNSWIAQVEEVLGRQPQELPNPDLWQLETAPDDARDDSSPGTPSAEDGPKEGGTAPRSPR